MHRFVFVLGIIQVVAAFSLFAGAETVMHEIIATLFFGPGTVCIGLSAIIWELRKTRSAGL